MKTLEQRVEELERVIASMRVALVGGTPAGASGGPGGFASDYEMSGPYADFDVKVSPRDWKGPPMKGRKASRCPPEFLDMLADTYDYFGQKAAETGEKVTQGKSIGKDKAPFDFKNARLARSWAKRLREGWQSGGPPQETGGPTRPPAPAPVPTPTRAPAPYGLSGHMASAKHTMPPERDDLAEWDVPAKTPPHDPKTGEVRNDRVPFDLDDEDDTDDFDGADDAPFG